MLKRLAIEFDCTVVLQQKCDNATLIIFISTTTTTTTNSNNSPPMRYRFPVYFSADLR